MNVAEHLEATLGRIERGWSSAVVAGVQVCMFPERPSRGSTTLATLGLSNAVLAMREGRTVRQELLTVVPSVRPPEEFAQLLLWVAERVNADGRAVLRGDVLPLPDPVAKDSACRALYAAIPVVFPESLRTLDDTVPATVFVWLFPVLPAEVVFIAQSGWSEFEDRLESAQPDLFDLQRSSVA